PRAQRRQRRIRQRLESSPGRRVEAPAKDRNSIRPGRVKPEERREEVTPRRLNIQYAALRRRVATSGHVLQQCFGDPWFAGETWVCRARSEMVSEDLPRLRLEDASPCQPGAHIPAQAGVTQGGEEQHHTIRRRTLALKQRLPDREF